MHPPIINIADLDYQGFPGGVPERVAERYEGARLGQVGRVLGARKLGYNVTVVPAGKRAFPFHNHRINEELFYVIVGRGEIRIGDATHAIRAGDLVACPPGGPDTAHQIVNTSSVELRFLAVSTRESPEICQYPDAGKFGVATGFGANTEGQPQMFYFMGHMETSLEYWDGE